MCSLPIRWSLNLLIQAFEVRLPMKCQMNRDHIEGQDDPSFGSLVVANSIMKMSDPIKHPICQIKDPKQDTCYKQCQYGTSK